MKDMLEILGDYLNDGGLLNEWTWQYELWIDSKKQKDQFIVIQSNGGTEISKGLGNDFYFSVYVIGKVGVENLEDVKAKAMNIIHYIENNPINNRIGTIHMQSPLGRPTLTEEKRVVYELLIRCVN